MAGEINVSTIAELEAALVPDNADTIIKLAAGEYLVTQPLLVPAGATLEGVGVMTGYYTAQGMASDRPQSRLKAAPSLSGDILTLGDGAALLRLTVEDVPGRRGNVVAVVSTKPDDRISARIDYCELTNPNPSSVLPAGPIGRALVVLTVNPIGATPPAPHENATVTVTMHRSAIHAPGNGSGIFAINFAPRGRLFLRLSRNRIGGGLDANGGVSRPFPVTGAQTHILSDRNLYCSDGAAPASVGWSLRGASNPPSPALVAAAGTSGNSLILKSYRDSVIGFQIGLLADGGWRPFQASGPVSGNCADLDLHATHVEGLAAHYVLAGASAGSVDEGFPPGDDNRLRVTMDPLPMSDLFPDPQLAASQFRHVTAIDGGALASPGSGNRLELYGIKAQEQDELPGLEDFYCGPRLGTTGY